MSIMKKQEILVVLVVLVLAIGVSGQEMSQRFTLDSILEQFDADGNQLIERTEARERLLANFDRVDLNNDNHLDAEELHKLVEGLRQRIDKRRRGNGVSPAVPESVKLEENVSYRDGESDAWKLDLAYPVRSAAIKRPAIIFIHGGGWRNGDKAQGLWRSLPLVFAEKGYVCASLNYRLLGEAGFPACIEDCKNAVRWLRAHAYHYDIDPTRIGAFGISAGGHLVSMLGLTSGVVELEGDGPNQDVSSGVQAVVCCATPTDFLNWDGSLQEEEEITSRVELATMRFFSGQGPKKALSLIRQCSPITYVKAGVPFLVIHGTADRIVPIYQGDSFVAALRNCQAEVRYLRLDDAGHGVFQQASDKTREAVENFFSETLLLQLGGK